MICFHSPKDVIDSYEFDVELLAQIPTSMHGSKEGHMGYVYRRKSLAAAETQGEACDPLFAEAQQLVASGFPALKAKVDAIVKDKQNKRATRRSSR